MRYNLSIIVPIYNVEKYLTKCLDSINSQTVKDLEVILVDDGSTDSSGKIADEYAFNSHKRIVIHKQNGGLASAIAEGIKKASGQYVGFVDSDDYIDKRMFSVLLDNAVKYDADISMCGHTHIYNDNQKPNPTLEYEGFYSGEDYKKILSFITPKLNSVYISPARCNKILKRDIALKSLSSDYVKISSGEDNYITSRWFILANNIFISKESLYFYIHRSTSISYTFKEQLLNNYSLLIEGIHQFNVTNGSRVENSQIINLYNFYGFLWCSYVYNSNLSHKEKKKQMKSLCENKEYRRALKVSEKGHVVRTLLYKLFVILRAPIFMEIALKIINSKS